MSDDWIPVRTKLRRSTFQQFQAHAAIRHITVPELLSRMADKSLKPLEPTPARKPKRKPRVVLTEDAIAQMRSLRATGWELSRLADAFDVSVGQASKLCRGVKP